MDQQELARQIMLKLIEVQGNTTKEEFSYLKGIVEGLRLAGNDSPLGRE